MNAGFQRGLNGKGRGGSMNRKGPKLREKCDVIVFYVMELNASLLPFCHAQGELFSFFFFPFPTVIAPVGSIKSDETTRNGCEIVRIRNADP